MPRARSPRDGRGRRGPELVPLPPREGMAGPLPDGGALLRSRAPAPRAGTAAGARAHGRRRAVVARTSALRRLGSGSRHLRGDLLSSGEPDADPDRPRVEPRRPAAGVRPHCESALGSAGRIRPESKRPQATLARRVACAGSAAGGVAVAVRAHPRRPRHARRTRRRRCLQVGVRAISQLRREDRRMDIVVNPEISLSIRSRCRPRCSCRC